MFNSIVNAIFEKVLSSAGKERTLSGGLKVRPDGYSWDRKGGTENVNVTKSKESTK